jgi:hypothetical protein
VGFEALVELSQERSDVGFEALVELSQERSDVGFEALVELMTFADCRKRRWNYPLCKAQRDIQHSRIVYPCLTFYLTFRAYSLYMPRTRGNSKNVKDLLF